MEDLRKLNVEELIREAEAGNPEAQCRIGSKYGIGKDVKRNRKTAVKWYKAAADQGYADGDDGEWIHGHPDAHYELACYYREGKGVEKNEQAAMFHFWYAVASFRNIYKTCSFESEPEYITDARRILVKYGDADMIAKVKRAARNGSTKAKEILKEVGLELTLRKADEEEKAPEEIAIIEETKSTPLVEVFVGEKVYHKAFGEGVVSEADGCVIGVDFESVGKKRFVNPDAFIDGFLAKTTV